MLSIRVGFTSILMVALWAACPFTVCAQEVQAPCGSNQVPMCYGEYASCALSSVGSVDTYIFVGSAGDSINIAVTGLTNALSPRVELRDPLGALLASNNCQVDCCHTCDTTVQATLAVHGVYYISVSDYSNQHAGNYAIGLERTPPSLAPIIDYGQTIPFVMGSVVDTAWFEFSGAAGSSVRIVASGLTNALDSLINIYDPTGAALATNHCQVDCCHTCSTMVDLSPLPLSGEYFIECRDSNYIHAGTINVSLSCLFGSCPPPNPPVALGTNYCTTNANSTGHPAAMAAVGSYSVSDNDVHFISTNVPPGRFGIFFMGQAAAQHPLPPPSQGTLCIAAPFHRLPLVLTGWDNAMRFDLDLTHLPGGITIQPGSTWRFEGWFRDVNPSQTTNTTDGLAVVFQ